ncbi:hypothetical protein [Lichenifustis flavocetrariae]|uniref:Uncharacterized protein n=1 Tax=Lichenifustis flavocetrariae TaxID=2949735 RepID=A0AA41YR15_9HYPH|nr:hypothetical protein [Lichenifustis flavocetrariae]MCW6506966.1 hypothetical protein [Lichenifustis flavocetrariae]
MLDHATILSVEKVTPNPTTMALQDRDSALAAFVDKAQAIEPAAGFNPF